MFFQDAIDDPIFSHFICLHVQTTRFGDPLLDWRNTTWTTYLVSSLAPMFWWHWHIISVAKKKRVTSASHALRNASQLSRRGCVHGSIAGGRVSPLACARARNVNEPREPLTLVPQTAVPLSIKQVCAHVIFEGLLPTCRPQHEWINDTGEWPQIIK